MIKMPAIVSRTLDPSERSLIGVIGIHDRKLSDADLNLVQSLQDSKRYRLLKNQTCSGALSYSPFTFNSNIPNSFSLPAFDVLLGGEVVTIGGNLSTDMKQNRVVVPAPGFWTPGYATADCAVYVAYLEFWFARLNPGVINPGDVGPVAGYYQDPVTGSLYFYPNGCINADVANMIPNDTIDPFQGLKTTERTQLQWAIRVVAVDPSYDFTKYQFGLDPGTTAATTVYAQGNQPYPSTGAPYQFTNMASINGDAGVWRAGDGNVQNELNSMDGYAYAMPLAVIFQRNTGTFQIASNPFGCASAATANSGLIASAVTGRFDSKFADAIYSEDVVDTRSTISLDGWDHELLMKQGFVDVIAGGATTAIGRGQTPGNKAEALGSVISYTIGVGATSLANTDNIGSFDGFMNGFGSSSQTSYTSQAISIGSKSVGAVGSRWAKGDAFVVSLPKASLATIASIQVQALVDNVVSSIKIPTLLLQGQVNITGVGTQNVTVSFPKNLIGTAFDPGSNDIFVLVGVQYPAGTGMDLRVVPSQIYGGQLLDATSGKTLPVFGVSQYDVQSAPPSLSAVAVRVVNNEYSNLIFGTRVWISIPAAVGTATTVSGVTTTSFVLPRTGLNGSLTGMYVTRAWDSVTGSFYTISARNISAASLTLTVQGAVATGSTIIASFLCTDTAQLVYNAPTKAVTAIEETLLVGNTVDSNFHMDSRVEVVSIQNTDTANTVVLAANGLVLRAISGDDVNKLIWVQNTLGTYDAVQIGSVSFQNGLVTLVVPPTVNLAAQDFFLVAAAYPAFTSASTLLLSESYIPYQGEGQMATEYEILSTEDSALVTTNGTGAAPVPGLADVYPYNRELPVSTTLPALSSWSDADLANEAVASFFDSNYEAMRQKNVEHTFDVPVHANDFIQPVGGSKRKTFTFLQASGVRGFSKVGPHVGYAIRPLTDRSLLGSNLQATTGPITLYVNNLTGSDDNDGQTLTTPMLTIQGALALLPPVLRHPCSIQLMTTGASYVVANMASSLVTIPLGDGDVRALNYYAIGNLSYSIQASGRLVISAQSGASAPVTIDASSFPGFGDGPTSAFFVENSRVIFNQIAFVGFRDAAVKGMDANIEFVGCTFTNNLTAGSFEQGSTVVLDGGTMQLTDGGTGFVLSDSNLTVSGTQLVAAPSSTPGTFFVAEQASAMTLQEHQPSNETNVSDATVVASAQLNSSIVCLPGFQSGGTANLTINSALQQTVALSPFVGGVTFDSSSTVTTSL